MKRQVGDGALKDRGKGKTRARRLPGGRIRVPVIVAMACLAVSCGPAAGQKSDHSTVAGNAVQRGLTAGSGPSTRAAAIRPAHVVVVVEENHSFADIVHDGDAPYIHSLMRMGMVLTNYHGVEHPSQPNYLDLFSGSNQGVTDDSCPNTFQAPNLARQLLDRHLTFRGYSEGLPAAGFAGCSAGWASSYARKHNPWADFRNLPASVNQPLGALPTDFAKWPRVSFIIPNQYHDMHSGSIGSADAWLQAHLSGYVQWAMKHHSLLIVTWDEDDGSATNHVPTIFVGPMVRVGTSAQRLNHFNLLRTLEAFYQLAPIGGARQVAPVEGAWK